jgi:hypothetical protein
VILRATLQPRLETWIFGAVSVIGVLAFSWPFLTPLVPIVRGGFVTIAAIVAAGAALTLLGTSLSRFGDSRALALVGVLSALAAAARLFSAGAGGIEFIFVIVILAGRALGPRGGFAVGSLGLVVSSLMWGGFGPWTPFQMLALGWVGAGAGLIPAGLKSLPRIEVGVLALYGAVSSYLFGALMNLWFWPLAIGQGTSISLAEDESMLANLARFVVYCLTTSTLTWDSVRAITTVVTLSLIGVAALKALRRVSVVNCLNREVLGLRVMEHERVG